MSERFLKINIYSLDRRIALVAAVVLFAATVSVDYVTSYELSLAPFYLFIVLLVTWNCSWKTGLLFAVMSFAAPTIMGELGGSPYSEPLYFYIDNANRLISYLVAMALTTQLKAQHEREKHSARRDYLTGLANLKGFYEELNVELARHRREKAPLSVAYVDCDNFKAVNDKCGHREGDRLLEEVAKILRSNVRKTDVVGRLGGDEFALVLSKTDQAAAANVIEKLRGDLAARMAQDNWPVTFSIGLAIFPSVPASEDEVILCADRLMYRVKTSGKNNVLAEIYPAQPGAAGGRQ